MSNRTFLLLAFVLALRHVDTIIEVLSRHELTHQRFLTVRSLHTTLGLHHFRLDQLELRIHFYNVLLAGQRLFVLDDRGGKWLKRLPGEHAVPHFDGTDSESTLVR